MFLQAQEARGNTVTVTWLMEVSHVIKLKQKIAISATLPGVLMALPLGAFKSGFHTIADVYLSDCCRDDRWRVVSI